MGATVTSTNPSDFANRIQTFFNPKLLQQLLYNLALADYGLRGKYPAIGQTIRFFRPRPAVTTYTGAIAEGTTPTNLTQVDVGYVDVPLAQRGALAKITDIVQAIDLLNTVQLYVKTMGLDAALDLDTQIRNALVTGLANSNATYSFYFERFAGVANTGNSSNDFTSQVGLSKSNAKHSRLNHLAAITTLKSAKVPMINGNYVAVTPPQVMHDMRQDTTWVSAAVYDVGTIYKNAQMRLDGSIFVEATNPFTEGNVYGTATSTDPGTGLIYSVFYLGSEAFGVPELANDKAGSNPYGPKLIILAQPDKADPLNLLVTVGWKVYYGAKALITGNASDSIVDVPRYVQTRVKSTFQ